MVFKTHCDLASTSYLTSFHTLPFSFALKTPRHYFVTLFMLTCPYAPSVIDPDLDLLKVDPFPFSRFWLKCKLSETFPYRQFKAVFLSLLASPQVILITIALFLFIAIMIIRNTLTYCFPFFSFLFKCDLLCQGPSLSSQLCTWCPYSA